MFKKRRKKEKKNELTIEKIKGLLSGEKNLNSCSMKEIKDYSQDIKIIIVLNFFTLFIYTLAMFTNPLLAFLFIFYTSELYMNLSKYEKIKELEKKFIEFLEEKKQQAIEEYNNKNKLSEERTKELIGLLNVRPIMSNNSLSEQGYSEVVDARPYFLNRQTNSPFNTDNQLNHEKVLSRRVV